MKTQQFSSKLYSKIVNLLQDGLFLLFHLKGKSILSIFPPKQSFIASIASTLRRCDSNKPKPKYFISTS